jgi:hypothetical protein
VTFELKREVRPCDDPPLRQLEIDLRFRLDMFHGGTPEHIRQRLQRTLNDWEDGRRPFSVETLINALSDLVEYAASDNSREERDWFCRECGGVWVERVVPHSHTEDVDGVMCWVTVEKPAVCRPCTEKMRDELKERRDALRDEQQLLVCDLQGPGEARWDEIDEELERIDEELNGRDYTCVLGEPSSELRVIAPPKPRVQIREVEADDYYGVAKAEVREITEEK